MFAAGPPVPGPGESLGVRRATRLDFDGSAQAFERPDLRPRVHTYVGDMVAPYGLPLLADRIERGEGHAYGEMAATLIGTTVPIGQSVDLLVLTFAVPDVMPGRATATYLSEVCPGNPFALTVSDQGPAAPFTGLRLARQYARLDTCRRVLLLIVEQGTLYYDPAGPAPLPTGAAGVALLCDRSATAALRTLRQHPAVAPERVTGLLVDELAALGAGTEGTTVLLGNGLAWVDVPAGMEVRHAPHGRPHTGLWSEAAEALSAGGEGRLVLADYDPVLGYLCLASLALDSS